MEPGPRGDPVLELRLDPHRGRHQLPVGQSGDEALGGGADAERDRLGGVEGRLEGDLAGELGRRSAGGEPGHLPPLDPPPHVGAVAAEPVGDLARREPGEVGEQHQAEPAQQVGELGALGPVVGEDRDGQAAEELRRGPRRDRETCLRRRLPRGPLGGVEVVGRAEPAVPHPGLDEMLGEDRRRGLLAVDRATGPTAGEVASWRRDREQPGPQRRHPRPHRLHRRQDRLEPPGVAVGVGVEQDHLGTTRLGVAAPVPPAYALGAGGGIAHHHLVVGQDDGRRRGIQRHPLLGAGVRQLEQASRDRPVGAPEHHRPHHSTTSARIGIRPPPRATRVVRRSRSRPRP